MSLLLLETFLSHIIREIQHALSMISLNMNQKSHMACNSLFESEWILTVTARHVHCKCGNISETVPDRVIVTNADPLIASDMWHIHRTKFWWPSVTFKVILHCEPSDVIFALMTLHLRGICCHRMSVCLYVCLSQAGVVPKWLHVGSRRQRCTIDQGLCSYLCIIYLRN